MYRSLSILLLLSLTTLIPACAQEDAPGTGGAPSKRDTDGRALAAEVVRAVGGAEAWNDKSWDLSFDFVVIREGKEAGRFSHTWQRHTDYYSVSGKNREGKLWRVDFTDVNAKKGTATIDGKQATDTTLTQMLEMGYGRFINDTYWLLMPSKLLDSGVHQRREADTTIGGKLYNVLTLSFGQVGLTPGDRYWLYIDPATKMVERWRYLLQSGREGEYLWEDYRSYGPLKIANRRRTVDGSAEIRTEKIVVQWPQR